MGKGTVSLDDLHNAGLIIVMGQNPGTNHPRMLSALKKCVTNGGRVVSVNPLEEAGTQRFVDPQSPASVIEGGTALSSLHIGLRINTDVALLKGVMRLLLDHEEAAPGTVLDHAFINDRTEGAEAFIAEEIIDPRDTRPLVVDFVHHAYRVLKTGPRSFGMRP